MENTLVWCKTKAQVVAVLTEAKKRGYNIDFPAEMGNGFWASNHEETVVNLNGNGRSITYSYKDWYINHPNYGKIITADKFLSRKPILITRNGRVVTAENKNTGEKAIATCCPTDTFDFGTGAMIAVARLIAHSNKGITKDAETVLRQLLEDDTNSDAPTKKEPTTKFKVGDLVTLKDGLEVGEVYGGITLREGMYDKGHNKPLKVLEGSRCKAFSCAHVGGGLPYLYSKEMLEPWDENKIREGDKVHVKKGCTKNRYDIYYQWLKDNISDIDLLLGFERKDSVSTTDTYTVVKIAPHGRFGDVKLAFIKRTNGIGDTFSYLYDIDALEKVTE